MKRTLLIILVVGLIALGFAAVALRQGQAAEVKLAAQNAGSADICYFLAPGGKPVLTSGQPSVRPGMVAAC
jgi:hypothetical protein